MKNLIALLFLSVAAMAQGPSFEVASIRPHQGAIQRIGVSWDGTEVTIHASTVRDIVMNAYALKPYELEGATGWMVSESDRYDIRARVAGETEPPFEQIRLMMQTLLAERFGFKFHRVTRDMPSYALVLGKTAPKLKPSDRLGENVNFNGVGQETHMNFRGARLSFLAEQLTTTLGVGRPVFDRTGISGKFDFDLTLAAFQVRAFAASGAGPATGPSGESIFTVLEEQLGLRLEPERAPVNVLVIDHAERPGEN